MESQSTPRERFGVWLKRNRKAHGYSQRELAAKIGCSIFTVRAVESGTRRPSRHLAERLVTALGVAHSERSQLVQLARERSQMLDAYRSTETDPAGDGSGGTAMAGDRASAPGERAAGSRAGRPEKTGPDPIGDPTVAVIVVTVPPHADARQVAATIAEALGTGVPEGS